MTFPPGAYPDQPNPGDQTPGATPPGLEWLPPTPPANVNNPFSGSNFSPPIPPSTPASGGLAAWSRNKTLLVGIALIVVLSVGSGLTTWLLTKNNDVKQQGALASDISTSSTNAPLPIPSPSAGKPSPQPGAGTNIRPASAAEKAAISSYYEAMRTHDLAAAKKGICSRVVASFVAKETTPTGDFGTNTSLSSYRILNAHPTDNDVQINVEVKSLVNDEPKTTKLALAVERERGVLKLCGKIHS